jgi:cytochrome c oxidase assembly protein subunit 15
MRRLRSPIAFRRLALVALAGLVVIVPSGAVVRLTASGLGCPDWPLCDGRVVPATAGHAWIEFSNRLLSAAVMLTCALTWLVARGLPGRPPALRRYAATAALLTAAQVPLGAVTVYYDLHPALVGAHFMLSMAALAAGTVLFLRARDAAAGTRREWDSRRGPLAGAVAAALLATLTTGVLVTAAGPHSGDRGAIQRFGNFGDAAHVHVRAAVVFAVLAAVLAAWTWREGGVDRLTAGLAAAALPLAALQIGLGEYQFRNGLPWEVVALHVSTAAFLWAVVVALAWGIARRAHAAAPEPAPRPAPRAAVPAG